MRKIQIFSQFEDGDHNSFEELAFRLAHLAEYRDEDLTTHLQRICASSRIIAQRMGRPNEEVEMIGIACLTHDIGKIAVPESVLYKPGPLTTSEYEIIKTHAVAGAELLGGSDFPLIQMAERVALTHHERWDGTGYPNGLKTNEIPIESRIVSLVDIFDALVGARCYKDAISTDKSIEIIQENTEKHFDPAVVDVFMSCKDEFLQVYEEYN